MRQIFTGLIVLLFLVLPVVAQDDEEDVDTTLTYGGTMTGMFDDRNPRAVYYFEGARCEHVAVTLRATSGNLDPVLMILDNNGKVIINRDDTDGSRDALAESIRIPSTGRYYVVAGRFGYGLGSTSGEYELVIERIGISSASGCMLRYGDSVQNTVTNESPKVFYSFQAKQGDIVNVIMQRNSGDLDPYLQVVNSNAFIITDNDDASDSQNARISNLLIEQTGTYIIVASRYGQDIGESVGNFVLTLEQSDDSGLGNSALAAIEMLPGDVIEDNLTDQQTERYYTFQAKRDDIITIQMDRQGGKLDPLLKLTNKDLQPLVTDDDGGDGQNARIVDYLIPLDGIYYILATRYEGEDAIPTTGRYRLQLESKGNAFRDVPPEIQQIGYGTTVTGNIDDTTPQILYAFRAEEGDVVTVSMNRGDGNLDAVVSILNAEQRPLISDDDGGIDQNARIERYRIPTPGIYYVRATRFSGSDGPTNTHGSFILVLAQRFD